MNDTAFKFSFFAFDCDDSFEEGTVFKKDLKKIKVIHCDQKKKLTG